MSIPEVTPDLLRTVLAAWEGGSASDDYARNELHQWAKNLERQQPPLPTVPGWYPNIVVERGGESCTGAMLTDEGEWRTARAVDAHYGHWVGGTPRPTIRWAEQDGTTPGQTLWEADPTWSCPWSEVGATAREESERIAAAVLAAHGTPTLSGEDRAEEYQQGWAAGHKAVKPASLTLTPADKHPEPGTRGLLPVWVDDDRWMRSTNIEVCITGSLTAETILVDPRPDGAHA